MDIAGFARSLEPSFIAYKALLWRVRMLGYHLVGPRMYTQLGHIMRDYFAIILISAFLSLLLAGAGLTYRVVSARKR